MTDLLIRPIAGTGDLPLMRESLVYFDGCPNRRVTDDRLRRALVRAELEDVSVDHGEVVQAEEAEGVRFLGSPTGLGHGRDPFPDRDGLLGPACRVRRTEVCLAGAPTVAQLLAVLR